MSTRFHFLNRIDMWSIDGAKVIEHLAGAEDFQVAMATYRAARERWPGMPITLSQGARVIESPARLNKRHSVLKSWQPEKRAIPQGIKPAIRDNVVVAG